MNNLAYHIKFNLKNKLIMLLLLFSFLFNVIFLTSCSPSWQLVSSITITTSGEEKTISSTSSHSYYPPIEVSETHYSSINTGRHLDKTNSIPILSIHEAAKKANYRTSYSYKETKLQGFWYFAYKPLGATRVVYYKKEYQETNYSLVYVKIVSDTIIKIKTYKGGETTYTVTSYSIRY